MTKVVYTEYQREINTIAEIAEKLQYIRTMLDDRTRKQRVLREIRIKWLEGKK